MRDFDFYTPTYIHFGADAELAAGAMVRRFGGSHVLLVSGGQSARRSGLLDRVEASLTKEGIACTRFEGAQPNPLLSHAEAGAAAARSAGVDFILAVGGGSVIDTAKAIAHSLANPGTPLWDFWSGKARLTKTTPLGVVLTIPAAGSEMSNSAVLTNAALTVKRGLTTDLNRPAFALMNPALALTLPWYQKACGITDIMLHTMERYFNPYWDNDTTYALAEGLLRTVIENGRALAVDPQNLHAMSEIMWCGSLSHNDLTGLGGQKDFATHQLGMAIGAVYDVAHGATLSATWGSWARYVLPAGPALFARYARNVWGISETEDSAAALAGIRATEDYFSSLGMPVRMGQMEVRGQRLPAFGEKELGELAEVCSFHGSRTIGSFRKLDQADIRRIYEAANQSE